VASDPSFELQKAIRSLLLDSDDVMALIPADHILDVTGRPERSPSIVLGEGQTVFQRFSSTAYADLHVWAQETGLETSKRIADAVIDAISIDAQIDGVLRLDGFVCHDLSVERTRYLRDPHGSYSHAIISAAAIMKAT
jgi:hypothetical protein